MKIIIVILTWIIYFNLHAQIIIYSDSETKVTGTWTGFGTLTATNMGGPCEGAEHYRFVYNGSNYWAGFGLNLNYWASSPGISYDFTPYNTLRLIYKGLSGSQELIVTLRNNYDQSNQFSAAVTVGYAVSTCDTVIIPLSDFVANNSFDLSSVTEIDFSITGEPNPSGTVYIDDIRVLNDSLPSPSWYPANETAWRRFALLGKGFNCSNWLEAFWLIQYNTYPEFNKYNRTLVTNLSNLGFNAIRLPVTFERIAAPTPPYTIPVDHVTWDLIDSTLLWAQELGMTVAMSNHHGLPLTNQNFQNEIPRIKAVWGQVADRYKNVSPDLLMFELYNEPHQITNANFRIVAQALIDTIRVLAPHHTLIVGGNGWNSAYGLSTSYPYPDSNIIYTFHNYDPFEFTHQGMTWTNPPYLPQQSFPTSNYNGSIRQNIEMAQQWADQFKVPVMMGEFGVSSAADTASRCNYIDSVTVALRQFTMPWYYWDAITNNDAFGFITNNGTQPLECFAEKLKLDTFDTCQLLVTSRGDVGPGSLREQILCANDGDTIFIHPSLVNDTILLENKPVFIHKSIVIHNANPSKVYLSASTLSNVIHVSSGYSVKFVNFAIVPTNGLLFNGSGTMEIQNCELHKGNANELTVKDGNIIVSGYNTVSD